MDGNRLLKRYVLLMEDKMAAGAFAGLPQVREKSGEKIFFQGQGKVREI